MPGNHQQVPPKKEITIIKAGSCWLFKHYFEDKQIFQELADYYDKDGYRFVRLCGKIEPQEQILLAAQKLPRTDRKVDVQF